MSRAFLAAACGLLLSAACGARTDLKTDEFTPIDTTAPAPGSVGGSGGAAGLVQDGGAVEEAGGFADAGPDAPHDAPVDTAHDHDATVVCATTADCDDGLACTVDTCVEGVCQHQSEDKLCDDGLGCTSDACVEGVCSHLPDDKLCDDGLFCTGVEVCSAAVGCQTIPLGCDDGVACTAESCDETAQSCEHTPDDKLCPLSHKCGLTEGCYAIAYAHSPDTLYEVRLPSGKVNPIGNLGTQLTDMALGPDGLLLGVSSAGVYEIDTTTGAATLLSPIDTLGMVALDAAPDGTFYTGGGSQIYQLDVQTGATTAVATYPTNYVSSGDIVFLKGRLLSSANVNGEKDVLVEHDLATGTSKIIGPTGYTCIWGLAAFGATLYGLTCQGAVLQIDPDTGASTLLSQAFVPFWGASAR